MTAQFEQGNQARLDVTREELIAMHRAIMSQKGRDLDLAYIHFTPLIETYDKLIEKVREELDRYE